MIARRSIAIFVFIAMVLTSLSYFFDYREPEQPKEITEVVETGSKMKVGDMILRLEIASTTEARERGLSGKASLPASSGMLFIFERPAKYSFWMKDMNFPIDIIWLDENYKVTGLQENALPSSYPATFSPESDSLYVLETNIGFIQSQNLKLGTQLEFIK